MTRQPAEARSAGRRGNSRRIGESLLLVTFCNVRERKPSVAALDLRQAGGPPRWMEIRGGSHVRGARGMCAWNGLVCVAHQPGRKDAPPPGFVLLDPTCGLREVGHGSLPSTPHSVCCRDGDLFFTMSREDSVYRAAWDAGAGRWQVSRHWTLPGSSGAQDENHVNAIEVVDGHLCISATGRREDPSAPWASAKRGFVLDIDTGRHIMRDIRHPHSLLQDSGQVWTCETRGSRIVSAEGREFPFPGDETWRIRGLAIGKEHFFVGVSKNRVGSASKGTLKGYEGTCRIYRLSPATGDLDLLIDLSDQRNEIYELMLV